MKDQMRESKEAILRQYELSKEKEISHLKEKHAEELS